VSDDQVRLDILEMLHNRFIDNHAGYGVDRAIIQETLKISETQMDLNMSYLEEKGLVTLSRGNSSQWIFAKLTAEGAEVIEDKEHYAEKFPFTQTSSSQINKEGFRASLPKASFTQQVLDAFKQATNQVFSANLHSGDKGKIIKQLKSLEKELQKSPKADLGTIQKDWDWLKKNASMLSPTIAPVILEAIKIALDIQ
jgi:DNA-binding PadR family transcriptional regulator